MDTQFIKINNGWNAEPNAPAPMVSRSGDDLILDFDLNAFRYKEFAEGDRGRLIFRRCWCYRLGSTNDEGWYLGQCRFSKIAPAWGEFYEVVGDLKMESAPHDWIVFGPDPLSAKHFLFYLRDQTFECDAESVELLAVLTRK